MSIANFDGNAFVCFTDISGFKVLLQHQRDRAVKALSIFYQTGFKLLQAQTSVARVEGLFVSDCGVLFVRPNGAPTKDQLRALLTTLQNLNREMLAEEFMLTTSIAYGHFSYESRREFLGIDKNLMIGIPYVEAFLDNEAGTPKLEPGQCRILTDRLPSDISNPENTGDILNRLLTKGQKHLYFYWMRDHSKQIDAFEASYRDAYNLKYSGMLRALRDN